MTMVTAPRFNLDDANRAHDEWGCNCGPSALAAIMGLTLDEVRPHMGDFERKGYTNPTLMFDALKSVGAKFENLGPRCDWPVYGLCRVQWEGPWTQSGVPMRARYRYTHWIGAAHPLHSNSIGVFDVNCINNGNGWVSASDWANIIVPFLTGQYSRANGKWHITHAIEVELGHARTVAPPRLASESSSSSQSELCPLSMLSTGTIRNDR